MIVRKVLYEWKNFLTKDEVIQLGVLLKENIPKKILDRGDWSHI